LAGLFSENNITNYDIIGISFYPEWSNFTNLSQLENLITTLKTAYNKDVMIFETGVPWTTSNSDSYSNIINSYGNLSYPISPQGQKQFFSDLTTTVYNAGGKGVLYWEPDWISSSLCDLWGQGSSYENMSFFNFSNNNQALPIFDVFNLCNSLAVNESKLNRIQVFPNPAKAEVTVLEVQNGTSISISDISGRIISKTTVIKNKISISELKTGVYFFTFYFENQKIVKKIIVE
jgi:hypothetical protein